MDPVLQAALLALRKIRVAKRLQKVFIRLGVFFACGIFFLPLSLRADYDEELRDQIQSVQTRHVRFKTLEYFHDMGILARKADEAELTPLTTEIVKSLLLKTMEEYVTGELKHINELYVTDPSAATELLISLNRFERFYQPTEDYKGTTHGQVLSAELARLRGEALLDLAHSCSDDSILKGLHALRATGVFVTNHSEEVSRLQEIASGLDCCLGWKTHLDFQSQKEFENDYEKGVLVEEVHLKLLTNRKNYQRAKWSGEWIYRFKGREGAGEGLSQATFEYLKGSDVAQLAISASRVSSAGRINFPMRLAGEKREVSMAGKPIVPEVNFPNATTPVVLVGCLQAKGKNE